MTPVSPGVVVDELNSIMQGKVPNESDMRHPVSNGADIAGSNAVDIAERRLLRSQLFQTQGVQTLATGSSPVATSRCARLPR
jgi:hypothetical protein